LSGGSKADRKTTHFWERAAKINPRFQKRFKGRMGRRASTVNASQTLFTVKRYLSKRKAVRLQAVIQNFFHLLNSLHAHMSLQQFSVFKKQQGRKIKETVSHRHG
jgi:hypothetical protein